MEDFKRAIEFAEYMARDASEFMAQCNALYEARAAIEEARDEDEESIAREDLAQAEQDFSEAFRSLQSSIYEFRKRAERTRQP